MLGNNGDGSQPSTRNGVENGAASNGAGAMLRTLVTTTTSNGTSKANTGVPNGSSHNGKERARSPQPTTYYGHDREEMTRLLIQALSEMGYQEAAASVGRDSGIDLENATVSAFRRAVLTGDWARTEELLEGARYAGDSQGSPSSGGLVLAPEARKDTMRFCVRRQKYLELIQLKDMPRALGVLRNELTPLCQEQQQALQTLAGYVMCRDSQELMAKADWDGMQGKSRQELLSQLSSYISPSVMLPEHRLAVLLSQVKTHQLNNCVYHTNPNPPSLYVDHHCDLTKFPSVLALELTGQTGEVWQVAFSHDGTKMASCGSEDFVLIWSVPEFEVMHKFNLRDGDRVFDEDYKDIGASGCGDIVWSPDDSMVVTCGRDHRAIVWNVHNGCFVGQYQPSNEPVTCAIWTPDGRDIILSTLAIAEGCTQWNLKDRLVHTWNKEDRIECVALSQDGRWLVMSALSKIFLYNFQTRELETTMDMGVQVTTLSICEESRYLLVHKRDGTTHLMDLATRDIRVKYEGCKGGDYAIRCSFGGANETYVISGSEDGYIFVWHKWTGYVIRKLMGHTPRTNSVSWCPSDGTIFASCGDDGKIKIWSNPERAAELRSLHGTNGHLVGGGIVL